MFLGVGVAFSRLLRRVLRRDAQSVTAETWASADFTPASPAALLPDPWLPPHAPQEPHPSAPRHARQGELPLTDHPNPAPVAHSVGPPTPDVLDSASASDWTADDHAIAPFASASAPADWMADALSWIEPQVQAPSRVVPAAHDPELSRARERASRIAARLAITTGAELDAVLSWLVPFFHEHRRPATYLALLGATADDLAPQTLRAMIRLREYWAERTDLWLVRSFGGRGSVTGAVGRLENGATHLTWKLARRICEARDEHPIEHMIDEDWVDAWHGLPPAAPGYLRFTEYLGVLVDHMPDSVLRAGMARTALHWGASDHAPARLRPTVVDPRDGFVLRLPTHVVRAADLH